MNTEQLQLFEEQTIRTAWDEEKEEWYFSIVDVVARMALEEQTGVPVITSQNALQLNHMVQAMIEASASALNES